MKHGVYSKQYSLAKRADKISYYLVFMTYIGCTSSKSMVSTWIVSYLLVYTWHPPLHYQHAANAGCVLAGVAPVTQTNHAPVLKHLYGVVKPQWVDTWLFNAAWSLSCIWHAQVFEINNMQCLYFHFWGIFEGLLYKWCGVVIKIM